MALPDALEHLGRIALVILVNGLWQGALVVFVTWLALTVFRQANASTRYAVWLLALLAVLVIPVATSLSRVTVIRQTPVVLQQSHALRHASSAAMHHPIASSAAAATASQAVSAHARPAFHLPALPSLPAFPTALAMALFAVWVVAALAMVVRLLRAFIVLEGLKRDSLPLSVDYRDAMPRWNAATKGERDVRICVSNHTEVPVAVGLFDAMILLPSHLVQTLDAEEVDQISLHELGHLLRADDWTNAVQRIISALLFFNPAVWFISRQLDVEREVACDDYVLQATGAVRPYASCLAKMAEMTAWPHSPLMAPGVFVTRKSISIRIERLLRTGRAIGSQIAPKVAGAVAVAMIAIFLLLNTLTPSVAFTVPGPRQIAQASPSPWATARPTATHRSAPKRVFLETSAAPKPALMSKSLPTLKPMPAQQRILLVAQATPSPTATPTMKPSHSTEIAIPPIDVHVPEIHVHIPSARALGAQFNCSGCNFDSADLHGRDFSGQNLVGANFDSANLQGVRFDRARLSGANFDSADLRNASFRNADMTGCNLDGAKLAGADFTGARLEGCNVNTAALSPSQARAFLTSCIGCNFEGANFNGQDLRSLRVVGTTLEHANFRGADLSGSSFSGVNFAEANFSGAKLDGTRFSGCNFDGADLHDVDLSRASFSGSNIGSAILR
jgi:uncharacterized protein YjbI with pentapeptide repeats/beta-lactamase regulating signal transducer with metallopeptidase domain